jgi:hypothetical protein
MSICRKVKLVFFVVLVCGASYILSKQQIQLLVNRASATLPAKNIKTESSQHHLMVFIHGTLPPIPSLSCIGSSLHTLLAKGRTLKKTWYRIYIDELRHKSIFKYQPQGPEGLHGIDANSSIGAQLASAFFTNFYQEQYPHIKLSCYTFGWSGLLSHGRRLSAANDLYQQLVYEVGQVKSKNISLILFGHSHGGNVVLNLARAEATYKQHLLVDKAILLGTPVQSETQALPGCSIFKSIYNVYSNGDRIQTIDFLSTKDPYSKRRFEVTDNSVSGKKLTQIELKLGKYEPGHSELWLWRGKNNIICRKNLPISPLPAFIFFPEIIQQLEMSQKKLHDVLVTIDQKGANYTIAISDKTIKKEEKKLVFSTLPKRLFTPYIQTMVQGENASLSVSKKA